MLPGRSQEEKDPGSILSPVVRVCGIVPDMDPRISASDYGEIEDLINSDDSPVGIDAKKTHVIIIHKLLQIEKRLEKLESLVAGGE